LPYAIPQILTHQTNTQNMNIIEPLFCDLIKQNDAIKLEQLIIKLKNQNIIIDDIMVYDQPPIIIASVRRKLECVQVLIKYYCNINKSNIYDSTALHKTMRSYTATDSPGKKQQYLTIMTFLIESGLDPNIQNNNGYTPLMCMCIKQTPASQLETTDRIRIIRLLLDYGADRSIINQFNDTAESIARRNEYPEIAAEIRDYQPCQIPETKGVHE